MGGRSNLVSLHRCKSSSSKSIGWAGDRRFAPDVGGNPHGPGPAWHRERRYRVDDRKSTHRHHRDAEKPVRRELLLGSTAIEIATRTIAAATGTGATAKPKMPTQASQNAG